MAIKEIIYKEHRFEIAYEIFNQDKEEAILFLHGWASSKHLMKQAFLRKLPNHKHIYLDMPGFGGSLNEVPLKTQDYANIVNIFLEALKVKIKIAVGHSFGGKVSTLLKTPCLVLLSSSGILVPKPWHTKAKITLSKTFKTIGAGKITSLFVSKDVKGMNQAMYETFKNVVDEDFTKEFEKSDSKTLCFWGTKDTATPLWTGEKITKLMKNAKLYPMNGDHFFFLNHSKLISEQIEIECKEN